MNELHRPDQSGADPEQALEDLAWAIEASVAEFSLILLRCNYPSLQAYMVQRLQEMTDVEIRVIHLQPSVRRLYETIQIELGNEQPAALIVLGLESVKDIDHLLTSANQVREEFRKHFPFPMVWWINDPVLQKLIRLAPDFESWATTTELGIAADELNDFLWERTEQVFTAIMEADGDLFLPNSAILGSGYRLELDSASQDVPLEPALDASLQFVFGREDYQRDRIDEALTRYQHSVAFWQARGEQASPSHSKSLFPNPQVRAGLVLLHIGLCYSRQAELERHNSQRHWQDALDYFQQGINQFESAQCPELVAKFINQPAQMLQRLESWEELQGLAETSLELHQTYGTPAQLAQDYGFLAQVALAQSNWQQAHQLSEQALQILNQAPPEQRNHQGLYRLLLGCSQQHLAELDLAVDSLERAKAESNPQDDPQLYIQILEKLRSLYFEQGEYLNAFQVKQYQRLIERQYGFRAFIGAGRLQSQVRETVAPEIKVSGRQQDVQRLINRISSTQHKFTVIYGQSGVGKSSVLEAGLVPQLQQQAIGTRDALPVYIRVYTDWTKVVGKRLADALEEQGVETPFIESLTTDVDLAATILEQLRQNESENRLTVLIFDQFEEFFFTCQETGKRTLFFEFLRDCLNISFVKVILSLREDYLYLLLECTRRLDLAAINNNILDKDVLYYLGNFSPDDARSIIRSLTQKSQFYLETALIEQLVQELAADVGEVRPIELQIVGAQLQTDEVTTLSEYQNYGSKEKFVQRYLEEIIEDCGAENQWAAELVLYLLTDENNTRPLRTRDDLANGLKALGTDLAADVNKLNSVLTIFVESGIVILWREHPADFYQLVHDYLVKFIREQQETKLNEVIAELEKERDQRKLSEEERNRLAQANQILAERVEEGNQILAAAKRTRKRILVGTSVAAIAGIAIAVTLAGVAVEDAQRKTETANQNVQEISEEVDQAREDLENAQSETEKVKDEREQVKRKAQEDLAEAEIKLLAAEKKRKEAEEAGKSAEADANKRVQQANQKLAAARANLEQVNREAQRRIQQAQQKENASRAEAEKAKRLAQEAQAEIRTAQTRIDTATRELQAAENERQIAEARRQEAQQGTKLERRGINALRQFQSGGELEALLLAMNSGQQLKKLIGVEARSLTEYPAIGPLLALQTILDNIREQNRFQAHQNTIWSINFSPDGEQIITAASDGTAKLWTVSGQEIITFPGDRGSILSASFSPDGKQVATAGSDGTVKLWNLSGQEIIAFPAHQGTVLSVSFNPDGKQLVTAGNDETARLWNLSGQQVTELQGHQGVVLSASFSPDGQQIATAGEDGTVRIWTLSGELVKEFTADQGVVFSVRFSPDGQKIATTGADGTARLWSLSEPEQEPIQFKGHQGLVLSVRFSQDGQHIITAGADGTARLWNLSGQQVDEFKNNQGAVFGANFSPDGKQVVMAGADGIVQLWNLTGQQVAQAEAQFPVAPRGVTSVDFSPDGQLLATTGVDGVAGLWDFAGDQQVELQGHKGTVWHISFSPDGELIATAGADGTVRLWNKLGQQQQQWSGHRGWVTQVTFSPDGQHLATAGADGKARLWNLAGEEMAVFQGHQGAVMSVGFSPDGQQIATAGWEDGTVRLWNLSGQQIKELDGHQGSVLSVNFSPDGNWLAAAASDGTVRLWDLLEQQFTDLKGHRSWVGGVRFSPDGQQLVTAGADGTIRLWDLLGRQIAELDGNQGKVTSVSFSPDGQRIAAAGSDGTVRLWHPEGLGLDQLLARGCNWLNDYLITHPQASEVCSQN
jgi:WD40 repeat protein